MATAQNKKLSTAVAATIAGPILSLTFSNGETLRVDANALAPEIQQAAMMHGLKQKLIDAAAIARDPETGRTAAIDDKFRAVREVYDRITAADGSTWNKVRGGESGGNKGGLLVRAMMRLTSKSREAIIEFLDAKTKDELAALRKNPRIAEIIAQLQLEQANTNGVDSDALLDSLMDGSEHGGDSGENEDDDTPEGEDETGEGTIIEPVTESAEEAATRIASEKPAKAGRRASTAKR